MNSSRDGEINFNVTFLYRQANNDMSKIVSFVILEVTFGYFQTHGFEKPILVKEKKGLGLT